MIFPDPIWIEREMRHPAPQVCLHLHSYLCSEQCSVVVQKTPEPSLARRKRLGHVRSMHW